MSQTTLCPHCFATLRFKRMPSKAVHCPKCDEFIGLAYLQRAAESLVEEADNSAETPPPESIREDDPLDVATAEVAPATSSVKEEQPRPVRQQTSEDWEDLEVPEPEEPKLLAASLTVLAVGAGCFFYGRMGGGITILKIVDLSYGFLYGIGIITMVLGVLMLSWSIESILTQGYESEVTDKLVLVRPIVFVIIAFTLWSRGYLVPPQDRPTEEASVQTQNNQP
jgi:hypothetical protein